MFAECQVHSEWRMWVPEALIGWEIQNKFRPFQTAKWSCTVVRVGASKWFLILEGKWQAGFHLKWTQTLTTTRQAQNIFLPGLISNPPDVYLFNCLCNNKIFTCGYDLNSTKSIVVLICLKAERFSQAATPLLKRQRNSTQLWQAILFSVTLFSLSFSLSHAEHHKLTISQK